VATSRFVMLRSALPRPLHPFAWWGYAIGLAVAASSTTNPLLLAGLIGAAIVVAMSRRGSNPWAKSFALYLWLAVFIVVLRVGFRILFGGGDGPTILLTLPEMPLPSWVRGIRLLGPVSLEAVLAGLYDGLRLATIVVCIGAANSLANPKKLLASLPAALYELGTIMVVAVSALPQLGESLQRVVRARRLRRGSAARSRRDRLRAVETIIVPVLSDALERSLALAASMDVRGYGRSGSGGRRRTLALGLGAIGLLTVWAFRFLAGSPDVRLAGVPIVSVALAAAGLGCGVAALRVAGRSVRRTQYRPIRWRWPETLTVLCGATAVLLVTAVAEPTVVFPAISPFAWPSLTGPLLLALAAAVLPATLTPPPSMSKVAP